LLPQVARNTAADQQLIKELVNSTKSSEVRSQAYSAWLESGVPSLVWQDALGSREKLSDALTSISQLRNESTRQQFLPLVRSLIFNLPESLRSEADDRLAKSGPAVTFEYYFPNPPNVQIETLDKLKPQLTGQIDQFETFVPGGEKDRFATRQTASLIVPASGSYAFYLSSDDGSTTAVAMACKSLGKDQDKANSSSAQACCGVRVPAT
jgi:hypothetical protein